MPVNKHEVRDQITITVRGTRPHLGTSTVAVALAKLLRDNGFGEITLKTERGTAALVDVAASDLAPIDQHTAIIVRDETPTGRLSDLFEAGLGYSVLFPRAVRAKDVGIDVTCKEAPADIIDGVINNNEPVAA